MEKLEEMKLESLKSEELQKFEGGGWVADTIAQMITDLKCGCQGVFDGNAASWGVGRVM